MKRLLLLTCAFSLLLAIPALAAPTFSGQVVAPWQSGKPEFRSLHKGQGDAGSSEVYSAIAGGRPVALGQAPYAVRLEVQPSLKRRPAAFCSGALITPRYVLTAAHCITLSPLEYPNLMAKNRFKVRFSNMAGKPAVSVAAADYWRNFSPITFGTQPQSDLALLRLAADAPVEPVALTALSESVLSASVRELGYGPRLKKERDGMQSNLYSGDMRFASPATCSGRIAGEKLNVFSSVEFCTRATPPSTSAGACHGDSGGPALTTSTGALIGITSWSMVENCDAPASKRETVFARADAAKGWLQRQTGAALFGEAAVPVDRTTPNAARAWVYDMNSRQVVVATSAREGEGDEEAAAALRASAEQAGAYYRDNGDLTGFAASAPVSSEVDPSGAAVLLSAAGSNGQCQVIYLPTSRGGINPRTFNIFCEGGSWKATTTVVAMARTSKKVYTISGMVQTDAGDNGIRLRFPSSWRKKAIKTISVEVYGRFYNSLDNGASSTPEAVTLRLR